MIKSTDYLRYEDKLFSERLRRYATALMVASYEVESNKVDDTVALTAVATIHDELTAFLLQYQVIPLQRPNARKPKAASEVRHATEAAGPVNCNIWRSFQADREDRPVVCERCQGQGCPFYDNDGNSKNVGGPVRA